MNKLLSCIFLIVTLTAIVHGRPSEGELVIRGGVRSLEGDDLNEAKDMLVLYLGKFEESEEGPHYKLGEIHSATKQVVSGSLYKILADLIDDEENTKKCHVQIWSQPWLPSGIEVKLKCEEEEELVKKFDS